MKKIIFTLLSAATLIFAGCEYILELPVLTKPVDETYGKTDNEYRLYVNEAYPVYFVGYNNGWGTAYAPLRGYNFSDDNASSGKQTSFENSVPTARGSYDVKDLSNAWISQYAAGNWNFAYVRKWNIMIDKLEKFKPVLEEEVYNHWMGVARFFRGFEYCRLVETFGDVPYYEKTFTDIDTEIMYKDRTPRNEVMEHVYNDFDFALKNIRENDGDQYLNRYIAAGFISRLMLFEGTWQKYHNNDTELSKKYLTQVKEAGDLVLNSGKWEIASDFRSLFGSMDLKGNKEVLMYRHYDAALGVKHCIASYSNGTEAQGGATLALAKAFICNDGKPYQTSSVGSGNANTMDAKQMSTTRDPRFEATFWDAARKEAGTLFYSWKFIDRKGPTYAGGTYPAEYKSVDNPNDYPVMRLAEVMLNWLEAKAELATMGGEPVTQTDINNTINEIRDRPLDAVAESKGVRKTAPMQLSEITAGFDPARDVDVDPLIWEIRRERRMEFVYEHSRLLDLKRWKKLEYMDNKKYPDSMLGLWVNLQTEMPGYLIEDNIGKTAVAVPNSNGGYDKIVYDGTNANRMVGFYVPIAAVERDDFSDRSYLAPVGEAQIKEYKDKGFTLTQTKGW